MGFICVLITSTFIIIFYIVAFLSKPCGHKHLHKKNFLLPSFHSPWIIVTIINYIDNKRNSIASSFLCCHKYSRWLRWAHFFLAIIITIMEGLGLFFSCCHKYSRWWDLVVFSLMIEWWRGSTSFWQRMKFQRSWACLFYK